MESIHVSELRAIVERAKVLVDEAIDEIIGAIDTKILVGNIHVPAEKKVRKKRIRKVKPEKAFVGLTEHPVNLPDADANNPFYTKKERKKKIDGGE